MKRNFIVTSALAILFAVSAQAEVSDAVMKAIQKECNSYAAEENVPEEELQGYIDECVQDLAAAEEESADQSEDQGVQE